MLGSSREQIVLGHYHYYRRHQYHFQGARERRRLERIQQYFDPTEEQEQDDCLDLDENALAREVYALLSAKN